MLQKRGIEEWEWGSETSAGKAGHVLPKSGQLTPIWFGADVDLVDGAEVVDLVDGAEVVDLVDGADVVELKDNELTDGHWLSCDVVNQAQSQAAVSNQIWALVS